MAYDGLYGELSTRGAANEVLTLAITTKEEIEVIAADVDVKSTNVEVLSQQVEDDSAAAQTAAASAASSEINSAASSAAAAASETSAAKWATNPEDDPVTPGFYSSYHWAQKAGDSVTGISENLANESDPTKGSALIGYKGRTLDERLGEEISAADYLVGNTQTQAIQEAIETALFLGGGKVTIPDGTWTMTNVLNMRSNVSVQCGPNTIIDWSGITGQAAVLFFGTIGSEVAISTGVTRGSTAISTVSAHGIAAGDLFQIKSQRNALSVDAGDDWRLGFGTPSSPACYFSEFLFAASVPTTTSLTSGAGLMFPNYNANNASETDPYARSATTVAKVNPVKNSRWIGGKFINVASNLNSAFRSNWAYNCEVVDVDIDKGQNQGSAVFWVNSYFCQAKGVECFTDPTVVVAPEDHAKFNRYKVAGGQSCWFSGCIDLNGSQAFDFTYFNLSTPSVQCGVIGCTTLNSRKNPMTSHPGCYMIDVINNQFLQCGEDGIAIRSRKGKISGNTLTSTSEADTDRLSYALAAYEGWGRDNIFENNVVEGFYYGIYEFDGADAQEQFLYSGNVYRGNTIRNCSYGAFIDPNALSRNTTLRMTIITHNTFNLILQKFLNVDPYSPGVTFSWNHCYGPLGAPGQACVVSGNSPSFTAEGNKYYNLGAAVVPIGMGQITDATTYPGATWNLTSVVRLNETYGPALAISVHRDQVRPGLLEQAGRPGLAFLTDGITNPSALSGYAMIYVDSADGDLKVKFGDSVVKVLATDT